MLHSRIDRIESLLQAEVGHIIDQELENPNLPDFITVYKVKVSKDLSHAMVLITFLQDQTPQVIEETVRELNHSAGYISRLVAQRIQLRRHPKLKFAYDATTHHALDMEKIFQQIKHELPETGEEQGQDKESEE